MRITLKYPCRLDVILPKKRTLETIYVVRTCVVEVPELDASQVFVALRDRHAAIDLKGVEGRAGLYSYSVLSLLNQENSGNGGDITTLFECDASIFQGEQPFDQAGDPNPRFRNDLPFVPAISVYRHMPQVRSVERDYGTEVEASLRDVAGECFAIGGDRILHATREPLLMLEQQDGGEFFMPRIMRVAPGRVQSGRATYSIADAQHRVDEIVTGRMNDDHAAAVRRLLSGFTVHRPEVLRHDPFRSRMLYWGTRLLALSKPVLPEMPAACAAAWICLRNATSQFERDPGADIAEYADRIRQTLAQVQQMYRLTPSQLSDLQALLDDPRAHGVGEEFVDLPAPAM